MRSGKTFFLFPIFLFCLLLQMKMVCIHTFYKTPHILHTLSLYSFLLKKIVWLLLVYQDLLPCYCPMSFFFWFFFTARSPHCPLIEFDCSGNLPSKQHSIVNWIQFNFQYNSEAPSLSLSSSSSLKCLLRKREKKAKHTQNVKWFDFFTTYCKIVCLSIFSK